jgi:vancomycin resistance protein YoaR
VKLPDPDDPDLARWRPGLTEVAAIVVSALVLLVGVGGYVVGFLMAGDRLPKNAVIAGVAVGGLDTAAAEQRLTEALGPRASAPVQLLVPGKNLTLDPRKAGLGVDVQASVAQAGAGRSLDPRHMWQVLTGGSAVDAVTTVDQARLQDALSGLAAKFDKPARDATIRYRGTDVVETPAVPGTRLDREATARRITAEFLNVEGPIEAAVAVSEPQVTTAEMRKVVSDVATPAVSGPVTLRAEDSNRFEVTAGMIADALSFGVRDGTLAPQLDADKLHEAAEPVLEDADLANPKDATITIEDGKPKITPGVNGVTVTAENLATAVQPVLGKRGDDRSATVQATREAPEFTTADAEALGIREVTGKFSTRFPYAAYRNHNIGRAAELINNTLLLPGKTFSLNKTLGERTRKNGYVRGYIIRDGRFRMELGGGVSQSATTTFNAAFFAGLKDVEHAPHGLYIDRYPPGREATVFWPTLDLRFKNDTDYGVLIEARLVKATQEKQGRITVRMWSTKTYEKVESSKLRRSNFTSGPVIRDDRSDCEPQEPVQGFDVNYERLFYQDGKVVKTEKFFWRYKPTSRVICV